MIVRSSIWGNTDGPAKVKTDLFICAYNNINNSFGSESTDLFDLFINASNNIQNCSSNHSLDMPFLNINFLPVNDQHLPIPVRTTTRSCSQTAGFSTRNLDNLVCIPTIRTPNKHYLPPRVRFGLWNGRSIRNKTTILCDFVISNKLDIMIVIET